ncbi:MAG: circadian clock protein KaiC [Deltaproteobacteria bacterium]|nr:circadian clock protein KaiC [Deltaproteobacteria bacterium]
MAKKRQKNRSPKGLPRVPTGISGLDEVLEGGMPKGRGILITGSTGVGKTVFLNEFIYRGITNYQEPGVFVTFEETPKDIMRNVEGFGWDYPSLIKQKKLAFVDFSPADEIIEEVGPDYDFEPIIHRIQYAIRSIRAKRVAIDSLFSIFSRFSNTGRIRAAVFRLFYELKKMGVTVFLSAEKVGDASEISRFGIEDYIADGVIDLKLAPGQQRFIRQAFIRKMRGIGYRSGVVEFEINSRGLEIYPKIPIERTIAKTDFAKRKRLGVPGIDRACGGGIPQGHILLVAGNTGTGKTLLGIHFLREGFKQKENGIYVNLEEPVEQLKKTASAYGWDLDKAEKRGELTFVSPNPIDIFNDKVLNQIVSACNRQNAKRVVIDSVSSFFSETMTSEQVRQFLLQLNTFFKREGITCLLSYLTAAQFGAGQGQLLGTLSTNEMRLSSVVDGVILLLYVERKQRVEKLMNVLKMRGAKHSRDIFQYEINDKGIQTGDKFTG